MPHSGPFGSTPLVSTRVWHYFKVERISGLDLLMSERRVERRLAAILAADVVGYSRLMGQDEVGTLVRLRTHRRELIDPKIVVTASWSSSQALSKQWLASSLCNGG